ncbi:MAG: extensin family protein [Xanthobacteraceae bacterium]
MRYAVITAALLCATPAAMAQNAAAPQPKPVALSHRAGQPQAKRQPPPVVLPQEFAPPQEAYASFPQSDAATAQAVPAAPSVCQVSLAKVAEFQPLPVLVGPGDCGADDAVEMNAITLPDQSKVAVTPPAIMRCPMAQQIADWVRDDVAPTLKGLPPLRGLDNLASYDCRGRNNVHAAKVSEHGRADALDVHDFKLADGRELGLTDVNIPKDWREAVRASACARFATVLGPGSDGYHEEHVHLDLEPRRNNYKICEWDVREPPPIVAQAKNPDKSPDKSPDAPDTAPASQLAQVEGVPLQGLDVPAIPQNAVPLPRPRPIAANAAQQRTLR